MRKMTLVERQPFALLVFGYGEHTNHQVQMFLHGYTCILIKWLLRDLMRWKAVGVIFTEACNFEMRICSYGTYPDNYLCSKCGYWYLHNSKDVNLNVVFLLKDFKIPYFLTRISPVSFSWRTNILLQLFSLLHLSARTSGFSFSAIRRILTEM